MVSHLLFDGVERFGTTAEDCGPEEAAHVPFEYQLAEASRSMTHSRKSQHLLAHAWRRCSLQERAQRKRSVEGRRGCCTVVQECYETNRAKGAKTL